MTRHRQKNSFISPRLILVTGLVMFSGAGVFSSPANAAQVLDEQTGIADPGRAQEQFLREMPQPRVSPQITVREAELINAPPGAEDVKLVLGGVRLQGNTVYTASDLSPIYNGMVGQEISLAEVYRIANQITLKYRNNGYILTQTVVPPQTIDNGVVDLRVVEGYIDNIVIEAPDDEPASALKTLQDYAGGISTGGPVNVAALERELLLINDLPGINARSIISPSPNQAGAADLLIIVERDSFDALVSMDNYGSRYLGPVQLTAAGTLNSWMGNNESITGQFILAPDTDTYELAYGALSYEQPVGPYGTRISALGSVTDTKPGYDLEEFDVRGHSRLMQLKATHPFIRSRANNLTGRILFDWRDTETANNITDTVKDRIRVIRAGAKYEFLDQLVGLGVNSIDLQVSHGLDIFGSSDEGDANLSRADADPRFVKVNADVQRLQRVYGDVNLLLQGRAQWSSDPLFSSEEFSVGGVSSGRGYDPSEIVGDDGISGRTEVQWNNPYDFGWQYLEKYQLYSFWDIGRTWQQDATNSADKRQSISSVGGGVRMNFTGATDAGFFVAFPLTKDVQTRGKESEMAYFSLSKRF